MNLNHVINLLEQVNLIDLKYQHINRITGRNFNIFKILGLQSNEVRLHSSIIAHLINPMASHNQGTLYLDLFLTMLDEKIKSSLQKSTQITFQLDSRSTKVDVEKYIGKQTEDDGGRIDILCQDRNNNAIIIENKIYANDQPNQLLRYYNYKKDGILVYLTLFGDTPDEHSLGGKNIEELNLILLSYERDITLWLELCLKESYNLPYIRETISQYLITIKQLTNQIEIRDMDTEIVNQLISNREKITAAIQIEKSIKDAKKTLLKVFGEKLFSKLQKKFNNKVNMRISADFGYMWKGISIYSKLNDQVYFQISFLSEAKDFYLEIFNPSNIENGQVKKNKDQANIEYYKNELNLICKSIGLIENVKSNWQGEWVCRYTKLDNYFLSENGWGDIADNKFDMIDTVINDITPIVNAMLTRLDVNE